MTDHRGPRWGPLSPDMVARSISPHEPIFRLSDVWVALEQLHSAGYGIIGWEGIVRYPDGKYGHPSPEALGTESINRRSGEPWNQYVERSVQFCRRTIEQTAVDWKGEPDHELCYAISFAAAGPCPIGPWGRTPR
jgi:hypothetical protein